MKIFYKDLFNLPNIISLFRIIATPCLFILWFVFESPQGTLIMGLFVGLSDLIDGILARKLNKITDLGALLDQLGDLLFESTALLVGVLSGYLSPGWLLVYLFREFIVTVLRTYLASKGKTLPSSWIGKAKSSFLQWAFFPLFLGFILEQSSWPVASWHVAGITPPLFLIFSAVFSIFVGFLMSLYSGGQYIKAFINYYSEIANKEITNK